MPRNFKNAFLFLVFTTLTPLASAIAVEGPKAFLRDAIEGNLFEIQTANLAIQKSSDTNVQALAQRLFNDHTQLLEDARDLAHKKHVQIPHSPAPLQKKEIDALKELSGNQFDRAYTSLMVADHYTDVHDFEEQAEKGHDKDVRTLATDAVPTLKAHLAQAITTEEAISPTDVSNLP
jgi:putative membrane protein